MMIGVNLDNVLIWKEKFFIICRSFFFSSIFLVDTMYVILLLKFEILCEKRLFFLNFNRNVYII